MQFNNSIDVTHNCWAQVYPQYAQVTDCRIILDEPVDGVWATGHFGVIADIATVEPAAQVAQQAALRPATENESRPRL